MKFFLDALTGRPAADSRTDSKSGLESLAPGRQVRATVVSTGGDGKAELSLMGSRVQASTELPLRTGQSLELTVEQTSPRLVLALNQEAAAAGRAKSLPVALQMLLQGRERLLRNLTSLQEFEPGEKDFSQPAQRDALQNAQEAARDTVVKPGGQSPARALPDAIRASGMNLEADLARALEQGRGAEAAQAGKASLKVAVKLLIRQLEASLAQVLDDPARAAELKNLHQALNGLGQFLDANQQLNAHILPERNSLFFSLPFLFGEMLQSGEMFFGLPEKDTEGRREGETSLAFFLTLSGLGQVVIQARLKGVFLGGEIVVETLEKARFVKDSLPDLEKALTGLGYEASFTVSASQGADLSRQSPLAEFIRQSGQYLSLTV